MFVTILQPNGRKKLMTVNFDTLIPNLKTVFQNFAALALNSNFESGKLNVKNFEHQTIFLQE